MKREKRLFWILEEDYSAHFWLCTHSEMAPEKRPNNVSGVCFFVFVSYFFMLTMPRETFMYVSQMYNVVHQQ